MDTFYMYPTYKYIIVNIMLYYICNDTDVFLTGHYKIKIYKNRLRLKFLIIYY